MQHPVVQFLIADAVDIVDGEESDVVDAAAGHFVEPLQHTVVGVAESDELPEDGLFDGISQLSFDLVVAVHTAVGEEQDEVGCGIGLHAT